MPDISYVPARDGGWMVLTQGGVTLAIDLPPESPRIADLWAVISTCAEAGAVLDEVIRTGISKAPAFILVGHSNPASSTVLVRGSAPLRVTSGSKLLEISGEGVSSWSEQVVDTSAGFSVWPSTLADDAGSLPLTAGVVWAAAFRHGAPAVLAAAAAPPVEPPPVEPPTVEPPLVVDLEATLASQTTTVAPVVTPVVAAAPPEPPVEPVESAPDASGYDHLFGETVFRNVEDAAVRPEPESETVGSVGPPPPAADGDHDGHTVMVSDIAALRAKRRAERAAPPADEPAAPTFYLELSTGGREVLDQALVIGRAPSASRVPGGRVPRLVSMNTPNQDISRTHAQVTAEGGTVVVTDLHSSNGTMITLPGRSSEKLRPGEPATIIVGTVIDLGDGATLTLCESS